MLNACDKCYNVNDKIILLEKSTKSLFFERF